MQDVTTRNAFKGKNRDNGEHLEENSNYKYYT